MRNEEMAMGVLSMLISVMSIVYLLPLFQALFVYERKKWLENQLVSADISGGIDAATKQKLLTAAEPGQSYPIYKLFKFYFASGGIMAMIIGFLIMVIPTSALKEDAENWLLFLPLVFGAGIYFIYKAMFEGQGLWREIAAVFLYVGFTATAVMAYGVFEMFEWMRSDILCYIILAAGFFIIMHLKSTFVSYLYMVSVMIAATAISFTSSYNWLLFFTHFIWFFAVAILYIWIPKLKEAKDVGPKEIIFGIVFTAMMLSLAFTHSAGLIIPSLAIILPGLYVFPKAYYKKALSIIGRPIEIIVIAFVIFIAATHSVNYVIEGSSDSIFLFKGYSFHKQFVYFILVGLAYGIYYIYDNDLGDNDEEVNPLIAIFPVAAFLIIYILGEYGGHYLMTFFLLALGYQYIHKGIDKKDSIRIWVGATVFVTTVIIKIMDMLSEVLIEGVMEGGKFLPGFLTFTFGALFLGTVVYVRSKWTVTDEGQNELVTNNMNAHADVIDNINTDLPKED